MRSLGLGHGEGLTVQAPPGVGGIGQQGAEGVVLPSLVELDLVPDDLLGEVPQQVDQLGLG